MKTRNVVFSVILALALGVLFRDVLIYIVQNLASPEGSHGLLILAVSLYFIWTQKDNLRHAQVRPALLPGSMLMVGGCLMLLTGIFGFSLIVQQVSLIPVLLGAVLLLAGYSYFKILLLPIGYLLFLTGIMEKMLGSISMDLQLLGARIATQLFRAWGFPVLLENNLIYLPHITLEVVRACSGVNHIVALVALAVPLAYLTQNTWIKKITLVLSALVIGILVNGLRVALIGVYALYFADADIHGPQETLYVSFIFFFGMLVLLAFSKILTWGNPKDAPDKNADEETPPTVPLGPGAGGAAPNRFAPLVVALLIVAATLAYSHLYALNPIGLSQPLSAFPSEIAGFSSIDLASVDERFRPYAADAELRRHYADGQGNRVDIYIGYFARQDNERRVIDYRRTPLHEAFAQVQVQAGHDVYRINRAVLSEGGRRSEVYFWFQMGPEILRNEFSGRLVSVRNTFLQRSNSGAVVVIETRGREEEIRPFLEQVVPLIHAHLSGRGQKL